MVVVALLISIVGIGFAGSSNRLAPGVKIAGTKVGGLTVSEARHKLESTSAKLVWVPVEFVAAGKRFTIAPAQLGVEVDWQAAVEQARSESDELGPLRGFKRLEMRLLGTDVEPTSKHSALALDRFLGQVAKAVNRSAREPALVLDGSQPTIKSGRAGRALNRSSAARLIISALSSLSRDTVTLPVKVIEPRVHRADLVRVMGQIRTVVSAPVTLSLGAVSWQISPKQIEKMLVYPHDGERSLRIASDKSNAYLNFLSKQFDRPARSATFSVAGPNVHIVPSRLGRVLDRESTAAAILRAALDRVNRIASVAMMMTEPTRTTEQAKEMGITGLVGSYETSFTGTSNRIHNVQLVAKLIDNKYIAPGAVFSFNQTTGERNVQKGFLTAPVIINGELSDALGGGVCQVSTTVFNAAFEAGLQIVARTNHALYISHYPLGRDATVNWPSTDLKFRNDTDHWMLLRTFTSSDTLLVALYGTPQHRRVVSEAQPLHIDGPPPIKKILDPNLRAGKKVVKEPGESSSSTVVFRRVYTAQGKLLYKDVFHSTYRSSPKVVLVGTKKKKPKGKTETTTTGTTTTKTTTTMTTTTETTTTETIPTETIPTDTTTTTTDPYTF